MSKLLSRIHWADSRRLLMWATILLKSAIVVTLAVPLLFITEPGVGRAAAHDGRSLAGVNLAGVDFWLLLGSLINACATLFTGTNGGLPGPGSPVPMRLIFLLALRLIRNGLQCWSSGICWV